MASLTGGPDAKHTQIEIDVAEPAADEVQIRVTHCGLCHSDVCLVKAEWGPEMSAYPNPQISGHEIIGEVVRVGPSVKHLKQGMRVGTGWYKDSCRHCDECIIGRESTCMNGTVAVAAGGSRGGFSEFINIKEDFALPIPEGLPSELAAPLMCGGITIYSPLVDHNACGKRVGIVGLGGIGAYGVILARARGNVVTVFSTSAAKEGPAKDLGAHNFVNTSVPGALEAAANTCDLIIVTAPAQLDWNAYLNCLRPRGALVFIGAVPGAVTVPIFGPLLMKQLTIGASITGGRPRIRDLLQFAADHKCKFPVELYKFPQVDEAIEKVEKGSIRFRAVLSW